VWRRLNALRIEAVEAVEAVGEAPAKRADHEVVVGVHEAERFDLPAEPVRDLREPRQEREPVVVVAVDANFRHAAGDDVEDAFVGESEMSRQPRHAAQGRQSAA
jgi:hypothetical protein